MSYKLILFSFCIATFAQLFADSGFSQAAQISETFGSPGFAIEEILWRAGAGSKPSKNVLWKGREGRSIFRIPKLAHENYYGACDSFHYNPDDDDWIDAYANAKTSCGLISILQNWKDTYCPQFSFGCRIAWGDISHRTEEYFSGHKTHTHGKCIDMRPLRQGDFSNTPLTYQDPAYDRQMTRKFLQFITGKYGASPVFFNDPVLIDEGLSKYSSGHDNHIHFCLHENAKLTKACKTFQPSESLCPHFSTNEME